MGMNYANAVKVWASRRKSLDYKAWKNDTHITIGENSEMLFTYNPFIYTWVGNKSTKVKAAGVPLAIVTPDNILTLLAETSFRTPTINNRLGEILGCGVYSDTSNHRNKESAVRISKRFYNGNRQELLEGWNNDPVNYNIPYKPGIQFQMDDDGCPVEVLNLPEDRAIYVKKSAVREVSKQTAELRKLLVAMARLGSFEDAAKTKAESGWWQPQGGKRKPITAIDLGNLTGEDATSIFMLGLQRTQTPTRGGYVRGVYSEYPLEERIAKVKAKAIDAGLKGFRKHIYETSGGYETVTVNKRVNKE